MKKHLFFLLLIFSGFACGKDNVQQNELSGLYIESFPQIGETRLEFINHTQVIISGDQLNNQSIMASNLNEYKISNQRISFVYDSANMKDTTAFWFELQGSDSLILTSCPPGAPCPLNITYLIFKK